MIAPVMLETRSIRIRSFVSTYEQCTVTSGRQNDPVYIAGIQ
jgi:hypothetical protein